MSLPESHNPISTHPTGHAPSASHESPPRNRSMTFKEISLMLNDDSKMGYVWKHHKWFVLNYFAAIMSGGFLFGEIMYRLFPSDQGIGYQIVKVGWIICINSLFWFQSFDRCCGRVSNRNPHWSDNVTTAGYSMRGPLADGMRGLTIAGLSLLVLRQDCEYWILLAYAIVTESYEAYQEWPTTQPMEERDELPMVTITSDGGGGFRTTRPTATPDTDYDRMV